MPSSRNLPLIALRSANSFLDSSSRYSTQAVGRITRYCDWLLIHSQTMPSNPIRRTSLLSCRNRPVLPLTPVRSLITDDTLLLGEPGAPVNSHSNRTLVNRPIFVHCDGFAPVGGLEIQTWVWVVNRIVGLTQRAISENTVSPS